MTMQKPSPSHRLLTLAALLAALPAAAAPNNITDLGTLESDNLGRSGANAVSRDGSLVAGESSDDSVPPSGRAAAGRPKPTSAR